MDSCRIIYNDGSLIALNKPAGVVSYVANKEIPLEKDAYDLVSELTGIDREMLRAVNRLDKGTSGLMLFCTSKASARHYANLIKNRKIHKEYVAISEGQWNESDEIIEDPIRVCSKRSYIDKENGKPAVTRIFIKKLFEKYSLLNLIIETGRKHQIRTHLASKGRPVAGDTLYGGAKSIHGGTNEIESLDLSWPLLHSVKTAIPEGGGKVLELKAPLPSIFEKVLALLAILLIWFLIPSPAEATDLTLYRNPPADMTWEIPEGWKKTEPPSGNNGDTETGTSKSWFSFSEGSGQLLIACENSPLSSLKTLANVLKTLIRDKKMKIDKLPELTTYGQYRALRILSPPETDHPLDVGRIFVFFAGSRKEISFKMAASSKIWEEALKTFTESLSSINIGILHRHCLTSNPIDSSPTANDTLAANDTTAAADMGIQTVLSDNLNLWSVLIPENYEKLPSSSGSNLFVVSRKDSKSTVELSVKYCPSIHAATLMEFFTTNIAMAGLIISKCATDYQNQWPAVSIEAEAQVDSHKVNLFYRLIKVGQFVFTMTGLCPSSEKSTFNDEFAYISQSIKLGSEYYGSDDYVNPSSISQEESQVKETVFETVAAIHSKNPRLPSRVDIAPEEDETSTEDDTPAEDIKPGSDEERRVESKGTLSLIIPPSYSPYQKVFVTGWSQMPDTLRIDSLGNIENLFYIKDPGKRARERVAAKYRVTSQRTFITPMKGNFFNLPPALRYRYTLSSTNVPYKHPRVISFVERWIKDDEIKTREETVETILKAVNLYTVPRKEPLSGSMNETGRNQKTDVTRMQWGSGALYALAHPESCGPSERADLLTAALRDRNIPVRRLYGHLLSPSGKTMIPHVWCEVFISPAGWVPADPTSLEENVQPILGLWSERYVFISREGPDFIVKSGPDRALLQEGYSRAHTKTMDIGIEVTRVVIDETTR